MGGKKAHRSLAFFIILVVTLGFLLFPSSPPAERGLAGDYHAQYHSQGGVRAAWAGDTRDVWIKYYNTGADTWWAWGPPPIRLGIAPGYDPNAMGEYYHESWLPFSGDKNRMTAVDNEPVYPGQVGHFQFTYTIPGDHAGVKRGYVRPVADGEVWMEDYGAYFHFVGFGSWLIGNPKWDLSGGRHVMVGVCNEVPTDFEDEIFGAAWPWVAQAGFPFEGAGRDCMREVQVRYGDMNDPFVYADTQVGVPYIPFLSFARITINSQHTSSFRSGAVDLFAIMMHEYGHVTGVGHNRINRGDEPPTYQRSVMYESYYYGGVRDLTEYELVYVGCYYWGRWC